jgi:quercetin dioxygenase-like cupin family protein
MAFFYAKDAVELGSETMTREHMTESVLSALSTLAGIEVSKGVGEKSLLLFKEPGEQGMSLVYLWLKSGYVLPPHSHNGDCLYYVVGGELHIGAKILRKGDGMFIPADSAYTYKAGEEGVEVLEFRNSTHFNIALSGNEGGLWNHMATAFRERAVVWETETVPPSERK